MSKTIEEYAKDIDSKLESQYGYREVHLANVADISSSTPQLTMDPKSRQGFYYKNAGGPIEQIDIQVFSSIIEKPMTVGQLDSSYFIGSCGNTLSNQFPYFEITTSASVITYKLDTTTTHLGFDEKCIFYHGLKPTIASDGIRVIQMSTKTLVSGTGLADETITGIKILSDSSALASDVDILFNKVGFQSNKNKNIRQQISRQISLIGISTLPYIPSVSSNIVWSNVAPGAVGKSGVFDSGKNTTITFIGTVDGACKLTVENSADGITFYEGQNSFSASGSAGFEITYVSGSRYHRLNMSVGVIIITAIAQSK
jgi:hypothetical protein